MRLQCPGCGTVVEERPGEPTVCPKCGFSGDAPSASAAGPVPPGASPYSATPYGSAPGAAPWQGGVGAPVPQPTGAPPQYGQVQPTNGMSIAALVMGVTGIIFGFTAILAVIFGIIGYNQARQRGEKGEGLAITGIVLGSLVMLFWVFWFVFMFSMFGMMFMGPI